tara:strand:- start:1317 stop:1796 length:480 start_codon:yes stop_codon:yes gene_type:complete
MKITDDRGCIHEVSRLTALPTELINRADRRHEIMRQLEKKTMKNVVFTETIGMLLLSVPFLFGWYGFVQGLRSSWSFGYLLFPFVVGVFGVVLFWAGITRPKTLRREISRLGKELELIRRTDQSCLVCRYALDGLVMDPDGCIVCPECGAAWRFRADHT